MKSVYMLCANHGSVTIRGLRCSIKAWIRSLRDNLWIVRSIHGSCNEGSMDPAKPWIYAYNHQNAALFISFLLVQLLY